MKARDEAKASGHELVFLLADGGGWPKDLYEKLGFEIAGRTWDFVRSPSLAGRE